MTTKLTFHPLAEEFPLMQGAEFAELVEDMRVNGQRHTITMFEGQILDGRNRYLACVELEDEPRTVNFPPGSYAAARAFVLSANAYRRHLASEDKTRIIETLLQAKPELSDRAIAAEAGVPEITSELAAPGSGLGHPPQFGPVRTGKARKIPAARAPVGAANVKAAADRAEARAVEAQSDESSEESAAHLKAAFAADEAREIGGRFSSAGAGPAGAPSEARRGAR